MNVKLDGVRIHCGSYGTCIEMLKFAQMKQIPNIQFEKFCLSIRVQVSCIIINNHLSLLLLLLMFKMQKELRKIQKDSEEGRKKQWKTVICCCR